MRIIVDRLGELYCVLLSHQIYHNNVPLDNTTPIYLINLPCKLG